jgi:hypothetical protein
MASAKFSLEYFTILESDFSKKFEFFDEEYNFWIL